ncbi:MAG TPA: MmgE/PrpD family protein [Gaiellaceae bacterium]
MTVEQALASWVAGLSWEAVPPRVQATVENLLLDAVASALAGRTQDLLQRADAPARAFAGPGQATVIGAEPSSPAAATFLNAYAVTSATICDVYRPGLCHVTPVTLPPVLALGEERDVPGVELLAAFAAGLEVTVRLSQALNYGQMRSRGWHSPGVVGPVGAAAAGARLLGLDERRVSAALAHAAAQGAGTFAALGTEAVKFNQARAAVSALLAVLVAEGGLVAAPLWLTDDDGGMAVAYTTDADPEAATRELGTTWELERISLRRWPAASSVQSLIELCLRLSREQHIDVRNVESVAIELGPSAYDVSGDRGWTDSLSAQQSARWVAAAVLHDGDWWIEQSSAARIGDPEVSSFARERVSAVMAPDLGSAGVRVQVALCDGSAVELAADHAPGDPEEPLDRAQIEEKLRHAAPTAGIAGSPDELIEGFRGLAGARSVAPVVGLLRAGAAR